jgi:hypothetical protein
MGWKNVGEDCWAFDYIIESIAVGETTAGTKWITLVSLVKILCTLRGYIDLV